MAQQEVFDIKKFIADSIHSAAFNELRAHKQSAAQTTDKNIEQEPVTTEDDVDIMLFHGGRKPEIETKKQTMSIKEGVEPPIRITTTEIKDFEKSFYKTIEAVPSASISFDKQKNGYSLIAYKRNGIEAFASGKISLGRDGTISWSYSIQNGLTINANNVKLEQSNKTIFEQLSNNYDDFQKKWRERLGLPTDNDTDKPAVNSQPPSDDKPNLGEPPVQSPERFL